MLITTCMAISVFRKQPSINSMKLEWKSKVEVYHRFVGVSLIYEWLCRELHHHRATTVFRLMLIPGDPGMNDSGVRVRRGYAEESPRCEGLKTKGRGWGQQTGHLRGPDEGNRDGCRRQEDNVTNSRGTCGGSLTPSITLMFINIFF